jgi:hypothetical protein
MLDLRLLITSLVSSNFSYNILTDIHSNIKILPSMGSTHTMLNPSDMFVRTCWYWGRFSRLNPLRWADHQVEGVHVKVPNAWPWTITGYKFALESVMLLVRYKRLVFFSTKCWRNVTATKEHLFILLLNSSTF